MLRPPHPPHVRRKCSSRPQKLAPRSLLANSGHRFQSSPYAGLTRVSFSVATKKDARVKPGHGEMC